MESRGYENIEEVLRLLAAAVNAVRLYPSSSELPQQALERFVARCNEITAETGTIRTVVDPHAFRIGESVLGQSHAQTAALAEALHAMQVGQLVIAPGLTQADATAFASVANADAREVRADGGARLAMTGAGASAIAVIEVTLRTSAEEGLLGVDLINAPLEEVAQETLGASARWHESAGSDGAVDEVARAVAQLEPATRDIAAARIAEAMMRLSDEERVRILLSAMNVDAHGAPMRGMLDVIARMSPATLARLLRMASTRCGARPQVLVMPLELPSEVTRELTALLAPSARSEAECGVPDVAAADLIAADVAAPGGEQELARMKAAAERTGPGKALAATLALVNNSASPENVRALADALGPAARSGALTTVREALRMVDGLAGDPALDIEIERVRATLVEPEVLAEVCHAVTSDAHAAIAGELLLAAGMAGARVLLSYYAHADAGSRSLLRPVLRGMFEQIVAVAALSLRADDTSSALATLSALPDLGESQAVPAVVLALEHLDVDVRRHAVSTLANMGGPESRRALAKALGHWDPETRRWVIREVGRVRAEEAIPALLRILGDINVFERNHELKKEVIKCLEAIGSREAVPVLDRWSKRRFTIGRKTKELSFLARRAVERLAANGVSEGVDAT